MNKIYYVFIISVLLCSCSKNENETAGQNSEVLKVEANPEEREIDSIKSYYFALNPSMLMKESSITEAGGEKTFTFVYNPEDNKLNNYNLSSVTGEVQETATFVNDPNGKLVMLIQNIASRAEDAGKRKVTEIKTYLKDNKVISLYKREAMFDENASPEIENIDYVKIQNINTDSLQNVIEKLSTETLILEKKSKPLGKDNMTVSKEK